MSLDQTERSPVHTGGLRADQRGEIAVAYLFVIAMSLLVFAAVMGMSLPIRTANDMTQTVLGQNTP